MFIANLNDDNDSPIGKFAGSSKLLFIHILIFQNPPLKFACGITGAIYIPNMTPFAYHLCCSYLQLKSYYNHSPFCIFSIPSLGLLHSSGSLIYILFTLGN